MDVFLGTTKGEQVLKFYSFIASWTETGIVGVGRSPSFFHKSWIFSSGNRRYKSDSVSDTISICVKFCEKRPQPLTWIPHQWTNTIGCRVMGNICSTSQFVAGQEQNISFEHTRLMEMRSVENLRCDKLSITFVMW